jgi:hypothetical protein
MSKPKRLQAGARTFIQGVLEKAQARRLAATRLEREVLVESLSELLGDAVLWDQSTIEPVLLDHCVGLWNGEFPRRRQYLFQDILWECDPRFTEVEMKLLIANAFDEERRSFERLKQKLTNGSDGKVSRPSIPESVRIEVWRRDGGACKCGSRERLEYDHIIPISKGGSNTARNIELLCEACNRQKAAEIK